VHAIPGPGVNIFSQNIDLSSSVLYMPATFSSHRDNTTHHFVRLTPLQWSANEGCLDRSRRLRAVARYGRPGALLEEAEGG